MKTLVISGECLPKYEEKQGDRNKGEKYLPNYIKYGISSGLYRKRGKEMSKVCELCGKGRQVGYNVSHAHNKTKKVWHPNIQKVRVYKAGGVKRINVCTRCIRSGVVVKPPKVRLRPEFKSEEIAT